MRDCSSSRGAGHVLPFTEHESNGRHTLRHPVRRTVRRLPLSRPGCLCPPGGHGGHYAVGGCAVGMPSRINRPDFLMACPQLQGADVCAHGQPLRVFCAHFAGLQGWVDMLLHPWSCPGKTSHVAELRLLGRLCPLLAPGWREEHGTSLKTCNTDSWVLTLEPWFPPNQTALGPLALKTLHPPPSPA